MNEAKKWILWLVLFSTIVVSGCTPIFISGRVSSENYEVPTSGATFTVIDSGSITLTESYIQDLIAKEMELQGFRPAPLPESADLAVMYSYSIGNGKTVVSSSPDNVFGGQKVSSSTSYPRYFQVSILNVASTRNENRPVFTWRAEIYSSGSSQDFHWLAEKFVPELFERYGKTIHNDHFVVPTTVPVF